MRTPTQIETLMPLVRELEATTDIRPDENMTDWIARQLKRAPEDMWVDAYIQDIRKFARFAGIEYEKDNERMGDYWTSRMIQRIDDIKAARPAPVEFLASVPAGAGQTDRAS